MVGDPDALGLLPSVLAATRAAVLSECGADVPEHAWPSGQEHELALQLQRLGAGPFVLDHAAALGLPEHTRRQLQAMTVEAALAAATLARETTRAHDRLQEQGIASLAFKGVALGVLAAGRVSARGNGDVDLLVRPADLLAAAGILMEQGWVGAEFDLPQLRDAWPRLRRCDRAVAMDGALAPLDLHWDLAKEPGLMPAADVLIGRASTITLGAAEIPTLRADDAMLAAAYHLHHDGYSSLRQVVDLVRLARLPLPADLRWTRAQRRLVTTAYGFIDALLGPVDLPGLGAHGIVPRRSKAAWDAWELHGRQQRLSRRARLRVIVHEHGGPRILAELLRRNERRRLRERAIAERDKARAFG